MKDVYIGETRTSKIVEILQQLIRGRSNGPRGTFTVTQSVATTTVTHDLLESNAAVVITPSSTAAAAEVASTFVSAVAAGSFTVTHPNNATAGRTFYWVASGG